MDFSLIDFCLEQELWGGCRVVRNSLRNSGVRLKNLGLGELIPSGTSSLLGQFKNRNRRLEGRSL